jgi:LDH2 family malate/lactate/ureidoglycolate dehydrogenase
MPIVAASEVQSLIEDLLARSSVPADLAQVQATVLLEAELRGVASHGILRLPRILKRIANGVTDPVATGHHTWRASGLLEVDGERGLGPVVATKAIDAIADRASTTGVAVAAISNSNHVGMLAWYAERVASRGQTLIGFSTSEALVHPWGGGTAMIGTNPITIGVPTENGPFVMDTATSIVSMGKIHDYANRGQPIPAGWGVDANGAPSIDPVAVRSGAISPFGGAKGYALGLAFELLVASLTSSALGREVRGTLDDTEPCNKGDLFIVINGSGGAMGGYLNAIRALPPADGFDEVRVPGDRARATRDERLADGIPVATEVWTELLQIAEDTVPKEK